jgi:GntR family transcriptional regulator
MREIVDSDSNIPRYVQISNWLREMINKGRFPVGQRLPSEQRLSEICGVHRNTVRQALSELVDNDLVLKRVGVGTIVQNRTDKSIEHSLNNITSFAQDMRSAGYKPSTRLISKKVIPAPMEIQEKLGLPTGAKIIQIVRLRSGEGIPLVLERSHLPYEEFKGILNVKLTGSLYGILTEQFGINLKRSYQILRAVALPQGVTKLLKVPANSPGMFLECIVYDQSSVANEVLHAFFRGDRYMFHVHSGEYILSSENTPRLNP